MLEQALKVVEAARALRLERKGRMSASSISDRVELALAIEELRASIENFDRDTAQGLGTPTMQARPDFATPPQLDEAGFVERQERIDYRAALPGMVPELNDNPQIKNEHAVEPNLTNPGIASPTMSPSFSPLLSIPAVSKAAALEYLDTTDLGDSEFNDGAESVNDYLAGLDAISDKLEYAVSKVGWTPRLRALAQAGVIARTRMRIDIDNDDSYVRVPVEDWSKLNLALVDAVYEMDNKMTMPTLVPYPSPTSELTRNQRLTPRPPVHEY